jgi:hypothetical protein
MEANVKVNHSGNLVLQDRGESIDILDAYDVWCVRHGAIHSFEYADHGMDEYWEVV